MFAVDRAVGRFGSPQECRAAFTSVVDWIVGERGLEASRMCSPFRRPHLGHRVSFDEYTKNRERGCHVRTLVETNEEESWSSENEIVINTIDPLGLPSFGGNLISLALFSSLFNQCFHQT